MKFLLPILTTFLLCFGCTSPQKLLEQGNYSHAFEQSLKKLRKGKIKMENVQVLEQSFNYLSQQDQTYIESKVAQNLPENWPIIYQKAQEVNDRQKALEPVMQRLQENGHQTSFQLLAIDQLLVESRQKSAIYAYARAQEYLPSARNYDRPSARKAYDWLQNCQSYIPDFRDVTTLIPEMRELGTNHILLHLILDTWDRYFSNELFQALLWRRKFPFRSDWQVYHLKIPEKQKIHYRLNLFFDQLQATDDELYTEDCRNTVEVQDGTIEVTEWSAKDSAYIQVLRPIYTTVSATLTTYWQSKAVHLELSYQMVDISTENVIYQRRLQEDSEWENVYSTWSGDERATNGRCTFYSGDWYDYPPAEDLFVDAAERMRWSFSKLLEKGIE